MSNNGMMFPKTQRKKRKKHKKSILHQKDGTCYLCMKLNQDNTKKFVQEHHVYRGKNRPISEAEGFKVYLCLKHHTDGPEAVHNNKEKATILWEDCQRKYEESHTRESFMNLIKKNYL